MLQLTCFNFLIYFKNYIKILLLTFHQIKKQNVLKRVFKKKKKHFTTQLKKINKYNL